MSGGGKIAALGADGLRVQGEAVPRYPRWENQASVGALFEAMRRFDIGIMHLHASALPLLGLPDKAPPPPMPGERRPHHPWMKAAGKLSTRALAPSVESEGREVVIGAYQDGTGDPFAGAYDALQLLRAQILFAEALGDWRYRNSAAMTGWNLMHAPHKFGPRAAKLAGVIEHNELAVLDGVDPGVQVEVPFGSWTRTRIKRPKHKHVLAFDVNGQRLAACARLSVGLAGLRAAPDDGSKLPGYHLVTRISTPHRGKIPAPFKAGWHTTPRVAMARYLGLDVTIKRSLVWEQHTPYLNPWYERMRDARAFLLDRADDPAAALALAALKQCYLQPLGRLRSARARERNDRYYRPHWYDAVIGQELAREYLRLHTLAEEGVRVLAVYFDTIIIETDELSAPECLPVSTQLGKYKHLGTMNAGTAHDIIYGESVGAFVKALKDV
jgi:hypothetical protein